MAKRKPVSKPSRATERAPRYSIQDAQDAICESMCVLKGRIEGTGAAEDCLAYAKAVAELAKALRVLYAGDKEVADTGGPADWGTLGDQVSSDPVSMSDEVGDDTLELLERMRDTSKAVTAVVSGSR